MCVFCFRNDSKRTVEFGSSLALGESASTYRDNVENQNQPTNATSPPPGVTFYNDVLVRQWCFDSGYYVLLMSLTDDPANSVLCIILSFLLWNIIDSYILVSN